MSDLPVDMLHMAADQLGLNSCRLMTNGTGSF